MRARATTTGSPACPSDGGRAPAAAHAHGERGLGGRALAPHARAGGRGGDLARRAAERYRESWPDAPPGSWGRPIGAMKSRLDRRRSRGRARGRALGARGRRRGVREPDRALRRRARAPRARRGRRGRGARGASQGVDDFPRRGRRLARGARGAATRRLRARDPRPGRRLRGARRSSSRTSRSPTPCSRCRRSPRLAACQCGSCPRCFPDPCRSIVWSCRNRRPVRSSAEMTSSAPSTPLSIGSARDRRRSCWRARRDREVDLMAGRSPAARDRGLAPLVPGRRRRSVRLPTPVSAISSRTSSTTSSRRCRRRGDARSR